MQPKETPVTNTRDPAAQAHEDREPAAQAHEDKEPAS